jgi:solute:Na+ symporter, SSS family
VVQMSLYILGALLSFFVILGKIPGGWEHVAAVAGPDKFRIFDLSFAPTMAFFSRPYTFWAGICGGCFLTTASHGTDQMMVQRLLSARNEAQSRAALLASWAVIFLQFSLFLVIGILLFVYYRDSGITPPAKTDRIYLEFIWKNLPTPAAGLVMAAILAAAMANLSAALNSLASTTVVDFYRTLRPMLQESHYLRLARLTTVAWGAVLLGIGIMSRHVNSVLEAGLTVASISLGALLGVFLLGVLTRRVGEAGAIGGVVAGLALMFAVWIGTRIAFTWYVLIGTAATFGFGWLVSLAARRESA